MKRLAAVLAVILGLCLGSGGAFAAADNAAPAGKAAPAKSKAGKAAKTGKGKTGAGKESAPPGKPILLKKIQKTKGPVTFEHSRHGGVGCRYCHHADDPGKESGCTKCHSGQGKGRKLSAKDAFHEQCKGCHGREGRGPTKCDECHRK